MITTLMRSESPTRTPRATLGAAAPLALALALAWSLAASGALAQEAPVEIPPPALDATYQGEVATAVFAGGCFWGVQGVFQHVEGVTQAVSGYAGGTAETATYDQTSTGTTGHAEVVQVTYDPDVVSYGDLLQVFFSVAHNPTQLNYQGPDHGTQYRSAIFPTTDEQAQVARAYIAQLDAAGLFGAPIETTIEDLPAFYPAESYHQDFLARNPTYPYIAVHDMPKIEALKALFPAEFRAEPVLVGQS